MYHSIGKIVVMVGEYDGCTLWRDVVFIDDGDAIEGIKDKREEVDYCLIKHWFKLCYSLKVI